MREMVTVTVEGEEHEIPKGTAVAEIARQIRPKGGEPVLGAIAHGKLVGLDCSLGHPTAVTFITLDHREGVAIYRRTACLLLYAAVRELYPEAQVVVGQSLGQGYFFDIRGVEIDDDLVAAVERKMLEFVERDEPVTRLTMPVEEARAFFEARGYGDKVALLQAKRKSHIRTVVLAGFRDIQHGPVAPSCGAIRHFALVRYPPGIVLQFDTRAAPGVQVEVPDEPKLFQTYRETREWNEILGVGNVGQLNSLCINGDVRDIIRVAEGFHEKKIAAAADEVVERRPEVRIVLIAGPSSSGKTTFTKRLTVQLRVAGIHPVSVSMDNWYRNRVDTPIDPETGDYDFECLEALDLDFFNDSLTRLLAGETVRTPVYDFHDGVRIPKERWPSMRLLPDQILLIEGIHGLNEKLTEAVPTSNKFKVYVSALTQLCLDEHNRIFSSDSRLLRRTVRDARYRGYDAETTLLRWESVRSGERKYIFPFQEQADVMFNSALVYEVSVLKVYAEHYLLTVSPSSPAYSEAYRLLKFLEHFVPIPDDDVPPTSILREFIGGSAFFQKKG